MCCISHCSTGKRSNLYQKDDPDWVPSVGMTGQQRSPEETGTSCYKRRLNRTQQRMKDKATAPAAAGTADPETDDPLISDYASSNLCSTRTQTDMTGDFIEAMTSELQSLKEELKTLICALMWHICPLPTTKVHLLIRMKRFYFSTPMHATPMQFRKHFGKKCAVSIDCFEVFIECPSNLIVRAETWSSYKYHYTVKFLIGITPQGTVSYISIAWGGRVSHKYITENCGFLDNIVPGDLVLADRGFNIQATLGCRMAHVKIPAFTRGKSQSAPVDLETTRKIAHVRIHVERVIGSVRQKYTILGADIAS